MSGVLCLVTRQWSRGIVFKVRFAIWLCNFIIPGASVILGMVMIDASLITLCRALCALVCSSTLCSVWITGGGLRSVCTHVCSKRNKCLPLGVEFVGRANLDSSLVRARRCW
jgi:hypothetical protein